MTTFDRVLPELLRICAEDSASGSAVRRYCVIRDVRGRIRLAVMPNVEPHLDCRSLEQNLTATLGGYFVPPVLSTEQKGDRGRLAQKLLDLAGGKWPRGWPESFQNVLGGGSTDIEVGDRWTGIERTIGKEAWLTDSPPAPPWTLIPGKTPAIVTFHSFKGGVGRTTLVAAYALRLATADPPLRVAVVDLDLEAPGLASLLGVTTPRGVLDVLVDHLATGRIDLAEAAEKAALEGDPGGRITVFGAGRVDDTYLQKLARLDFSSTEPGLANPVGQALVDMLLAIKGDCDVILLDSRAGLHDLAGMSLHGLAHVEVLVFRGTEQNLAGMAQTLRTLGSRGASRLVLVETLLPADEELSDRRKNKSRERAYELLCQHVYPEDDPPQLLDVGEPHDVVPVGRKEWLDGLDSVGDRISDLLQDRELVAMGQRIDEARGSGSARGEDDEGEE